MSLLPERKKTAGEIAKLRESLGIAGPPPVAEEPAAAAEVPEEPVIHLGDPEEIPQVLEVPGEPVEEVVALPATIAPLPVPEMQEPKPVRSLRRSERIPVLPLDEGDSDLAYAPEARGLATATPLPAPPATKTVRSLRKSEQAPLPPPQAPPPDSKLPIHRHNEKELSEIRRHEALAKLGAPTPPPSTTAHLALVIPGYLAALGGAVHFYFYDVERQEMWITAACALFAVLVATFIFIRKPLSRHHAAFIAVATLFVVVFGALYYFPQLRHGT